MTLLHLLFLVPAVSTFNSTTPWVTTYHTSTSLVQEGGKGRTRARPQWTRAPRSGSTTEPFPESTERTEPTTTWNTATTLTYNMPVVRTTAQPAPEDNTAGSTPRLPTTSAWTTSSTRAGEVRTNTKPFGYNSDVRCEGTYQDMMRVIDRETVNVATPEFPLGAGRYVEIWCKDPTSRILSKGAGSVEKLWLVCRNTGTFQEIVPTWDKGVDLGVPGRTQTYHIDLEQDEVYYCPADVQGTERPGFATPGPADSWTSSMPLWTLIVIVVSVLLIIGAAGKLLHTFITSNRAGTAADVEAPVVVLPSDPMLSKQASIPTYEDCTDGKEVVIPTGPGAPPSYSEVEKDEGKYQAVEKDEGKYQAVPDSDPGE